MSKLGSLAHHYVETTVDRVEHIVSHMKQHGKPVNLKMRVKNETDTQDFVLPTRSIEALKKAVARGDLQLNFES